jgi:excisionase family DNA binding protein
MTGTVAVTAVIPDTEINALETRITESLVERLQGLITSPWMNIAEAADYLACPKKRLYNLVGKGEIPHRKQNGRLLFSRSELDRWLDEFYVGPEELAP